MKRLVARYFSVFLSLFLLVTANVCSQKVYLKCKFKPGDVERYKETTQNIVTSEASPGVCQTLSSVIYTAQKVTKVDKDGSAEVIRTLESVYTELNGQPFSSPQWQLLQHLPIKIIIASTGKILDAKLESDSVSEGVKQAADVYCRQIETQPYFPLQKVAKGQTWRDSAVYSQESQVGIMNTKTHYSTKFLRSTRVAGYNVKVLDRSLRISGTIGDGTGIVRGSGKGKIYFADDAGKEIMSTMNIEQTISTLTPQGTMKSTIKVTHKKELVK